MDLVIYSCGGNASNIVKQVSNLDITSYFIDTSDSNLRGVDPASVFLVPGTDGAGKDRSVTYEAFKPHADDVLIRFKPSNKLNVVVANLCGGSGSVISSLLTKSLISSGMPVIVIGIDSRDSTTELENCVKTLQTFKSFSSMTKKSIGMFLVENHSRKEADNRCIRLINMLQLLVDRKATDGFDTADLANFINFDRVTKNEPTVSILEVVENIHSVNYEGTSVVSTILITTNPESVITPVIPEYLATCIVVDENYTNEDIRVNNLLGMLSKVIAGYESEIKSLQEAKRINHVKDVDVKANTDDGFML